MAGVSHAPQPGPIAQRFIQALPAFFLVWLLVAVVGPWKDLYETVFHALVIPAALVTWRHTVGHRVLQDPFVRLVSAFFGYVAISTFFVGPGSIEGDLKIVRWSIEAFLSVIALWVCTEYLCSSPAFWGRFILGLSVVGTGLGFAFWDQGRIEGFGALSHPIQGSSVILAYLAMGGFLLTQSVSRWRWPDCFLVLVSCWSVASFILMSESRGPILAFVVYFFLLLPFVSGTNLKSAIGLLVFLMILSGVVIEWHQGLDVFLTDLVERGDSKRLEIWKGYLLFPPDSLLLGYGASIDPEQMHAAEEFWRPNGYVITHAHNLWLGTYAETGLIGVIFLLSIIGMLVWASVFRARERRETFGLLGIVALVLMLTFTDEHTLVLSMKPIWLIAWLPLILVWQWTQRNDSKGYP